MRILWLANIPSPYSVNFFNELGKLCELTVLFELNYASDRDESWKKFHFENFRGIQLKGIRYSNDKAFCPGVTRYLSKEYDIIVVSNMPTFTGILSIIYLNTKKIPFVMQGDGGFKKNQKGIREKLKHYLISGAQYCLSTGKNHDEYYMAYGANPTCIYRIPFTSVYKKDILAMPPTYEEKRVLRKKLGLKGNKIILSVGQFIYRKGYDVLLNSVKYLGDVAIYIIGGKPTEEYLSIIEKNKLSNVYFLDFMNPVQLRQYYQAADLFVLPTREDIWGLVVNEAMSQALPVVTTNGCIAGIEMIENGKNGYIVPIEDAKALSIAVNKVINASNYNEFCKESLEKSKIFTIENTAKVHYEIFERIIES